MRVNARAVWYDGHRFGSVKERDVFIGFQALQKAGKIKALQAHPEFVFVVNGVKVGRPYKADGSYIEVATNRVRVYDAKGFKQSKKTGRWLPRVDKGWKKTKDLMLACFGITVEVI